MDRTRTVLSLLVAIMFAGIASYIAIPIESDPDIAIPVMLVFVPHEGIAPEDAERLLARPMELELRRLEGIDELNSYSNENGVTLVAQFDSSFDPDLALTDVRNAVDAAKSKLPNTAEEPVIQEISSADDPVIGISISGAGVSDRARYRLARELQDAVETIPEVLEANVVGSREELLEAVVDPSLLEAHRISNQQLLSVVARNNRLIAAGAVDTGRGNFSVKIPSVLASAADVLSLPIKASQDGVVTLSDIVTLRRTFKDATSFSRTNGAPSVVVEVTKRPGTSIVHVVGKIKALVETLKKDVPDGVEVSYIWDLTPETIEQINTLEGNITTAMFLVLAVVVVVVGLRSGLLVAFGIPFSFLFAFIVVNQLGFTYNFMIMFGMLLGLGMLIDGAIVIVELADRKLKEGEPPTAAYIYAVRRMFLPVVASTSTTLVAFLPLMLWPGTTGEFIKFLPITAFTVLVGALLYALLFVPVLGTMITPRKSQAVFGPAQLVDQGRFSEIRGVIGWYARLLHLTTAYPLSVIGIAVALLVSVTGLYLWLGNGSQYFIDVEPGHTGVVVSAKGNYSAEEGRSIVTDVEHRVTKAGNIANIYTRSSGVRGNSATVGRMYIQMTDRHERTLDGFEVQQTFDASLQNIPGVQAEIRESHAGPRVGKALQIQLVGKDLDKLIEETRKIRKHFEGMEGLVGVDDTAPISGIEWQVRVDRARAAMAGADVADVGAAIQLVTNGVLVGRYLPDDADEEVDIRVRYPEQYRSVSYLDQLRVSTSEGPVPISSFVERTAKQKVATIFRQDGERTMYIRANTAPGVLASRKLAEIKAWLATQHLDPSVKVVYRGANEEAAEAFQFIIVAFILTLMLMGILLVTQFNSFYQALLVLSAVVMSTVGVLLGLIVTQYPFSAIMTGIGIVALAGIIVNNNIVLIDTFNVLRRENPDWDLQRVIVTTGCQRLRPVFLTTFTTGFGLLPMACGISIDLIGRSVEVGGPVASYWVQLALAIVSGLSFATLLTLVVTPALLMAPVAMRKLMARSGAAVRARWAQSVPRRVSQ